MNEKPTEGVHSRDHLIFIIVTLIYWISLYIYVPILAPYLESLGATYTFVGIVLGSYGLMQIFIRLPLGIYSDRLRKRRPFIALGLLTSAVSCFCFAFTDQLGWGLAARAISGISASTWVAFTVLYASYYAKNETAKAMGTISLITVSGQLLGMGISGLLAEQWGWHSTFLAGGIIALIGFAAAFAIK
jgi:MFS family permease